MATNAPISAKPKGRGSGLGYTHRNLIVRSVSGIGILIVCDTLEVGKFDTVAILREQGTGNEASATL